MSTALLQCESDEKLQTVLEFARQQGVQVKQLSSTAVKTGQNDKSALLRGGDGKSIFDPIEWQSQVRVDRN